MRKRALLAPVGFVVLLGGASTAWSQATSYGKDPVDPNVGQGYAHSMLSPGDIDAINLYNLQLTIPIPLGPSYPIGPELRLQLLLTFNSRPFESAYTTAPNQRRRLRTGNPALGVNWNLTLGAIKECAYAPAGSGTESPCYYAPDGSQHAFGTDASGYALAKDGTTCACTHLEAEPTRCGTGTETSTRSATS